MKSEYFNATNHIIVLYICDIYMFMCCRSIVYLEIDNRQCYQQSDECFQSATDVAAFLGALASSGNLNVPYIIEAVTSEGHIYAKITVILVFLCTIIVLINIWN